VHLSINVFDRRPNGGQRTRAPAALVQAPPAVSIADFYLLEGASAVLQGPHAREEMPQRSGDVKAYGVRNTLDRLLILLSFNDKNFYCGVI